MGVPSLRVLGTVAALERWGFTKPGDSAPMAEASKRTRLGLVYESSPAPMVCGKPSNLTEHLRAHRCKEN